MPVDVPDGYTAATWLTVAPGGHFAPLKDDAANRAHVLHLVNKPAWLIGSATLVHKMLMTWYYDTTWLTSPLCSH
jgi:hypothetical protein